jgi:hypothetical protein
VKVLGGRQGRRFNTFNNFCQQFFPANNKKARSGEKQRASMS